MKWIDLRSDTVTKPTEEMRRAMYEAEVGDDVYGDDPTVNRLEELAAQKLAKDAALFVPSGTMGNQLSILSHTKRGDEIIVGAHCHIVHHEAGAPALLSGVNFHLVDNPDGTIRAQDIHAGVRGKDIHYPDTALVCVENALANGRVVPLDILWDTYQAAKSYGLPVHMDGARIFNAAVRLGVDVKEVASCCDTVMFCLSKGLCAPVGSILAGPKGFVARARKYRKILGGGMRQLGVLAAPGIIALEQMTLRLKEDHDNADYLARKLAALPQVECDTEQVEINMVFFRVTKPDFHQEDYVDFLGKNGVLVNGEDTPGVYRLVTHYGVGREELDRTVSLLEQLLAQ